MLINKIQNQNFGQCRIHKSAQSLFKTLPGKKVAEILENADSLKDTKYWDLLIKSNHTNDGFMVYFINKKSPSLDSFIGNLFPFEQDKNTIKAVATHPTSNKGNKIHLLEFENEKRAGEVYKFLKKSTPPSNMNAFSREFNLIKILEESSEYMHVHKHQKKDSHPLVKKIRKFFE